MRTAVVSVVSIHGAPMLRRTLILLSLAVAPLAYAGSHDAPPAVTPPAAKSADPHAAAPAEATPTADEAIARLREGNARFVDGAYAHPNQAPERRCATFTGGQHPFAAVLSCADSRVPPELVFDTGIGDLFVVRVAGNVADTDEIASLEYAVGHLNVPVIVVIGHSKCGAVTAVCQGGELHGNLAGLLDNVRPAVDAVKKKQPDAAGAALVSAAVRANVLQSMQDLLTKSPDLAAAVKAGKVKIVGAVYDIHGGMLDWIGEHPQQSALAGSAREPAGADAHAPAAHDAPAASHSTAPEGHPAPAGDHGASGDSPAAHAGSAATSHRGADAHAAPHGDHDAHGTPAAKDGHAPTAEHGEHGDGHPSTTEGDADKAAEQHVPAVERQGWIMPAAFAGGTVALGGALWAKFGHFRKPAPAPHAPAAAEAEPAKHA
jgi:carbonic anhydrase